LFDIGGVPDANNKNKNEAVLILNTLLNILNSELMSKEFINLSNKHKSNVAFDASKLKGLRRRILTAHYCPFTYILKINKTKDEYLSNPEINTGIIKQILILCSLQRLIFAYTNLNTSMLQLCKKKLSEIDGAVATAQLRLYSELLESPVTKFLNNSNVHSKCQNVFNAY
jgi:hypothetical protein